MNTTQWRNTDCLFVFGSLMDSDVLAIVADMAASDLVLTRGTAHGYRQCEVCEESYPVLVASDTSSATGLLINGLSPLALDRILFFEGEEYSLQPIDVTTDGESLQRAHYFRDTGVYTVRDTQWDFDQWRQLHKGSFMDVSREYMSLFGKMSAAEADAYWTEMINSEGGRNTLTTAATA